MGFLRVLEIFGALWYGAGEGGDDVDVNELTEKQRLFIQAVSEDGVTPTQAAIRAGYSKRTASAAASRLLNNVKIKQILNMREERRQARTGVTPEWIMERTAQIAQDEGVRPADQLKALDMLAKMNHMYDPKPSEDDKTIRVVFGEAEDWSE